MAEQGLVYNIKVNASDATKKIQQLRKDIETTSKTMSNLATHSRGYLDTVSKSVASLKETVFKLNLDENMKKQLDAGFTDLEKKLRSAKSLAKKTSTAVGEFNKDTVDSLSRSWKGLEGDLKKIAKKSSEEVQKATKETEKSVVSSISNIQSAIATIGITKLTKDILDAASAAERALFALNKIYRSNAEEAQATAESLADIYALSEAGAARQLADASKILDNYNLADDVLLSMSSNMVALSQDLSAFTGGAVDASRAMQALEAALNADYRGLKRTFGVYINNDAMEAIAKRWGLQADALNDAQKVLLRYQAIMEATTNVAGTFQESQNSLYVTEQELKAAWEDLQVILGEKLLPLVTTFLKFAVGAIEFLGSDGIGTFVSVTASAVALVSILNKLLLVGGKLITVIRGVTTAMMENPIIAVIALCAALAVAIGTVIKKAVEAQKVAGSSDDVIKSIDDYTAAEKERAKAIGGTTQAMLALEAAQKKEDAIDSANKLVKQLKSQTGAENTAKFNLSNAQKMLSSEEKQVQEALSYWEKQGLSREDAADRVLDAPAWEIYQERLEEVKGLTEDLDAASSSLEGTLKALAESYFAMSQSNATGAFTQAMTEIREALTPEQVAVFDEMLANLAKGLPAVVEETEEEVDLIKQLAQELNFVEKDWDKMLEKSSTQLENSREALKKQSDEYRKIRDDALAALKDEYDGSIKAIDEQIKKLNDRKADSPNPEAIDEEIKRLEASKKKAEQWYNENYEYYNNVYAKNIQTAAEQLETKLAALVYKREQTLKEQETQTVSDLKTKWEDYAKTFNASIGGGTNIGSVGTSRSSLNAYINSIKGMEGVTQDTIDALTLAWETYYGSLGDIQDYYERLRAEKMRELEDALLAVELSAVNLSEEAKYDIQKQQLERQHQAELDALEREYKDAAEYASMKAVLEEKHRKEDENAEKEHQKRLTEIAISEATSRINRIANAVSSANLSTFDANRTKFAGGFALLAAQRGNREESRFSALGYDTQTAASMQAVVLNAENKLLSATTSEEEQNIKAEMYDELYKLAVKYADNLDDLRDKIRQEALNDVNITYRERMELEMKNLEDEKTEALGKIADKESDAYKLTEQWYNKRISNLESKQAEELEKISREQNKALIDAQTELLYDKTALYEAEKKALEDEMNYELEQAEKTGKDKVLIEQTYNAKIEKVTRDHYTEMKAITRQYREELLNSQAANNAARGGWFDLITGALDRRDASRSQVSMGLTDYIGGIEGINQSKFQTNASAMDEAFNKMLNDSMMIGSKKSQEELQEDLKKKLREMLDDVEYAGEDFELIWGNVWEKIKANTKSEWDSLEEIIDNSLSKMSDILGKMDTLYTMAEGNRMQNLQNMLTDLQNQRDKLEKEASDSGRKLTRKEQDELKRRQALYEEQIERQEELIKQQQERQFERQKEFSIAETTIQGIQAAVQSFTKNGGWPWGVAAAALSAAFTGAQIAMIKAQPMPSYAQGAYELPEDQTAQVHKGEMIVPKPFAEELRDKGGLGGEITVNIYGAGEDAVVESSTDSDDIQQLDIFVSSKVKGMVMNGELDTVLQSRYTLSRNGRRG